MGTTGSRNSVSAEPDVQAMPVEQQPGHLNGVHSNPEAGAPTGEPGCLPDTLVNFLLPEVPPGNLGQTSCGIPVRAKELVLYFGLLIFKMVTGWFAFVEYHAFQASPSAVEMPIDYIWLGSLVILVVYNLIGPFFRALGDLLGVIPGNYYRYKLQQNDCLHRNSARSLNISAIFLVTCIQTYVFSSAFFTKVMLEGIRVLPAVWQIVVHVGELGYDMGTFSVQDVKTVSPQGAQNVRHQKYLALLHEALYSHGPGKSRSVTTARQKLAGRMILVMVANCIFFGLLFTTIYVSARAANVSLKETQAEVAPDIPSGPPGHY